MPEGSWEDVSGGGLGEGGGVEVDGVGSSSPISDAAHGPGTGGRLDGVSWDSQGRVQ